MKRKLVMTMAAAMSMVLMLGTTAMAAGGGFGEGTEQHNEKIQSNDPDAEAEIPVYGYVGPDTTLIDDDPDDKDNGPKADTDIHVSVPVKLIWAAFESDAGAVSSPDYYIKNHSSHMELDVTLESFDARTTSSNTVVDSDLTLTLEGLSENGATTTVFSSGSSAVTSAVSLGTLETTSGNNTWNFTIGGSWAGSFSSLSDQEFPIYDMVLKFAQK